MANTSSAETHRFGSFAAVRDSNCHAKWFVDGKDYMEAVADAIETAEKEIYITDWQLNPSIYLKRPKDKKDWDEWRLDKLLIKKAERDNVQVHILVYEESRFARIKVLELGTGYNEDVFGPVKNIHFHKHGWGLSFDMRIRWSHHEKMVVIDRKIAFLGGLDLCFGRWDTPEHRLNDNPENKDMRVWKGKDYKNTFVMDRDLTAKDYQEPMEDFLSRETQPRMPWHDVACCVTGPAAIDLATHFDQRYNKVAFKSPALSNEFDQNKVIPDASEIKAVKKCQVLRSAEESSTGFSKEDSIHQAFVKSIETAEHFIYIESQFFVSSVKQDERFKGVISNKIMEALADRIIRAFKEEKPFRVIIVIPLKPEFSGTWENSDELKTVAYLNYSTIIRADDSLYKRLIKQGVKKEDIPKYVSFYSLRAHDTLNGKPVTEVIYVHTKTMVVDDRVAIIGSANINDRSMLGDRDTELALIVEDESYSKSLRCHLAREHLGLKQSDGKAKQSHQVDNPATCYDEFRKAAESNTQIFEDVFGGQIDVTDKVTSYEELREHKNVKGIADKPNGVDKALAELKKIQGHIVIHPLHFLEKALEASGKYKLPIVKEITKGGADDEEPYEEFKLENKYI